MQNWASNLDEQVRVMCADAGLCVKFTSVPARARAVRARLRLSLPTAQTTRDLITTANSLT